MSQEFVSRTQEISVIADRLIGRAPAVQELVNRCILDGSSIDKFRAEALKLLPSAQPIGRPARLDINPRELKRYSLSRAIAQFANHESLDGIERELSDEIAHRGHQKPEGFWCPDEVMLERNYVAGTGTLGGFLVQTDNLGSEFIQVLRNHCQVLNLGARTLNLTQPTTIPRQSGAGTVNWVGETVASTLSAMNFTQVTLTPRAVAGYQQYSKTLLLQADPSIDQLIRGDMLAELGNAIDLAALHGTGSGQPTGIAATTGIGTVNLATNGLALGNATAYPFCVSMETAIANSNGDTGSLAYLMRPAHRAALKTQQRFSSTDSPVFETVRNPDGSSSGIVNGYRAEVSAQIATNLTTGTATTICSAIFFGDWSSLMIAQFGATDIQPDPFSMAERGIVRICSRRWVDVALRVPAKFAVGGGILTN